MRYSTVQFFIYDCCPVDFIREPITETEKRSHEVTSDNDDLNSKKKKANQTQIQNLTIK